MQTLWETGGNGNGFLIYYDADNQNVTAFLDGGTHAPADQVLQVTAAPGSISASEFNHLAVVYDKDTGGTDRLDVYLDGQFAGSDVEAESDVNDCAGGAAIGLPAKPARLGGSIEQLKPRSKGGHGEACDFRTISSACQATTDAQPRLAARRCMIHANRKRTKQSAIQVTFAPATGGHVLDLHRPTNHQPTPRQRTWREHRQIEKAWKKLVLVGTNL